VDRGADRAPGVEDVVDQDDGPPLELEVEPRVAHDRLAAPGRAPLAHVDVVAVEGDVELAELELHPRPLLDEPAQPLGERDAAGVDADERDRLEVVVTLDDLVRDPRECAADGLPVEQDPPVRRNGVLLHRAPFRPRWTELKGWCSLHSSRAAGRRRPSGWTLALALAVAGAAALRAVAALAVSGPWLLPDEAAYALLGRGLWRHADLAVLGGPSPFASALYPALAGLPLLAGEHAGYAVLRVLQALALCSAAVAVYAWARMVARPPWALAAAVLTLALPGLAYAGELVAETLLLPLATLAGWLAVRALEAPSRRNQLALVAALACCAATRGEANALAPALLAAALATGRVRALWPTWAGVAAVAAVWLGLGGGTPLRSLGSYGFTGAFTAHRAVDLVLEHAGELLLVCGVVPACAAALLALGRPRERPARATAVYALALAAVASVEAGVFS